MEFTYKGQTVRFVEPADSAFDAFQTVTTRDDNGNLRGRGDFVVENDEGDEFRIFAEDRRVAKMVARQL